MIQSASGILSLEHDRVAMAVSIGHRRRARERLRASRRGPSRIWIVLVALLAVLAAFATLSIGALVFGLVWFGQFVGALPPPDQLTAQQLFLTTRVYAADGVTVLYEITDPEGGRRTLIPLDLMPRSLIEATIATEDAGFFSNPGFEFRSIIRAAIDDLTQKQIVSGASTITQQVVRNVLLTRDEQTDLSARRKIREVILAYQLTQTYSKEDILQIYLNEIPYGNRSFGIEAAAEGYFGKSAANLDLAESALLAGLPQAPGFYDPYRRFSDVKDRQVYVLQRMVDQGYITDDEAQAANAEELHFVDPLHAALAPHFVAYVSGLLEQQLGSDRLFHGGSDAITTLDVNLERSAQQAIAGHATALRDANANNVAVVALDPHSGRILALVGSANYDDPAIAGEVDMAMSPRPSAGILSPLTYVLALGAGQTLNSSVPVRAPSSTTDVLTGQRQPAGATTLADALGRGFEVPAEQMMRLAGNDRFIETLGAIGIPDAPKRVELSGDGVVSGASVTPLEVAQVYAAMANGGVAHQPVAIERVLDQSGKTIWQPEVVEQSALDPNATFLVSTVLADKTYQPDLGDIGAEAGAAAMRTAFADNRYDSWAAGYDSNLALVVWVGNASGVALKDSDVAASIWSDIFQGALASRPAIPFEPPPDVVSVDLCANPGCTVKHPQFVIRGTEAVAQSANLTTIANPVAVISDSRTPLVNRGKNISTTTVASPAAAQQSPGALITVPDVARSTPDQARQRLVAAGLTNAARVQYVSGADLPANLKDVAVGQVAQTLPASGIKVQPGTSVILVVRPN
jgi:membrane peptidoglycan carboxypeptidase